MKYEDKKFAILGDSISTYTGYNPDGYPVFYEGQAALDLGVFSVEDTWWMRVLRFFSGVLCTNNSYTGSRVCGTEFPAANRDDRIQALSVNGVPDVIIIYLGANDYGGGDKLYGNGVDCFEGAYTVLLEKLRRQYPNAELICTAGWRGVRRIREPSMLEGGDERRNFSLFNDVIRRLAEKYGCLPVDLEKNCGLYDSFDGVHPTGRGMKQISETFINTILRRI